MTEGPPLDIHYIYTPYSVLAEGWNKCRWGEEKDPGYLSVRFVTSLQQYGEHGTADAFIVWWRTPIHNLGQHYIFYS